jgi:hypothetical protein
VDRPDGIRGVLRHLLHRRPDREEVTGVEFQ